MGRTYTDELASWVKKQETKGRDKNLVAFHGVRDDVSAAMEAGFSAKTVWANMHESGRLAFGYETFLSYVNRHVKTSQKQRPGVQSGASILEQRVSSRDQNPIASSSPVPAPTVTTLSEPLHTEAFLSPRTPATPSTPASRTGMPTFKFNPVPTNKENSN
jgi:hypothetical protein